MTLPPVTAPIAVALEPLVFALRRDGWATFKSYREVRSWCICIDSPGRSLIDMTDAAAKLANWCFGKKIEGNVAIVLCTVAQPNQRLEYLRLEVTGELGVAY